MAQPIRHITIVGGGTAGWITAAYLNHRLQWGLTAQPGVRITLIESPLIKTIGVGEATVPTLKGTLRMLEISEAEFIARTNATFKLGIRFDRWQVDEHGQPQHYIHPFSGGRTVRGRNPGYAFQHYGVPGQGAIMGKDFIRTIGHAHEAIEQNKGPRPQSAGPFESNVGYAYHIDAGKLAEFLKEICVARGVEYLRDDVTAVRLDERGFISRLELREGGDWPVELVIDCSGFKGLLINEALQEPFVPFSDYLFNDRAIPIQVGRRQRHNAIPATLSTAYDAGWGWRISLRDRDGTGYVYSSAFKSDDAALAELKSELGTAPLLTEPRVLNMRIGHCQRSWVKNCVAIGLSSGFIEPLESTAIMSIELAARWLLQYFPSMDFEEARAHQFNRVTQSFYEEVRDFVALHFILSNRDDTPYWRAVRHDMKRSDVLNECLALWRQALPSVLDPRSDRIFSNWSVQSVLFGKGFYQDVRLDGPELVPETNWRWHWAEMRAAKRTLLPRLPDHLDLVDAISASAIPGDSIHRTPKGTQYTVSEEMFVTNTQVMQA